MRYIIMPIDDKHGRYVANETAEGRVTYTNDLADADAFALYQDALDWGHDKWGMDFFDSVFLISVVHSKAMNIAEMRTNR